MFIIISKYATVVVDVEKKHRKVFIKHSAPPNLFIFKTKLGGD